MGLWIVCYFFNLSQRLQKCDLKVDSVLQVFETLNVLKKKKSLKSYLAVFRHSTSQLAQLTSLIYRLL